MCGTAIGGLRNVNGSKQMGRRPEFEDLPNWWWVVYHFFPLQYQLAWTWRLPKPGHALHAWTEGTPERGALWSEEQERDLLRVREGGRNFRVFFSPFSLSWHPGRTTLVAAVAQWQQGRHLKLKEENPFLLSNGAVILRTWSKFHCCFLHCLSCCLALDADAVSVAEWGKLKPTNTRLVQYLKISQCNLPY